MTLQRTFNGEGIILRRLARGETDRQVVIYSKEHGKIRLIARGVRRINSRRSGHLEPFRIVSFSYRKSRAIDSLSEIMTLQTFESIQVDLVKTGYAFFVCEMIDKIIPENEPSEQVYKLTRKVLQDIDLISKPVNMAKILTGFVNEILRLQGFLPHTKILTAKEIVPFIEQVIERPLRTPPIVRKFH